MNARHVANVALNLCFDQIAVPRATSGRRSPGQRSGISAGNDALRELATERLGNGSPKAAIEQGVEKARPPLREFALRQRMQSEQPHAPCQGIGECGYEPMLSLADITVPTRADALRVVEYLKKGFDLYFDEYETP
jgi:hypothetical protein